MIENVRENKQRQYLIRRNDKENNRNSEKLIKIMHSKVNEYIFSIKQTNNKKKGMKEKQNKTLKNKHPVRKIRIKEKKTKYTTKKTRKTKTTTN